MPDPQNPEPKKRSWAKPVLFIVFIVLLAPVVWWYAIGSGLYHTFKFFGIDYVGGQDGTHLLQMTDEQRKKYMSPEQYEAWKKIHGSKDEEK